VFIINESQSAPVTVTVTVTVIGRGVINTAEQYANIAVTNEVKYTRKYSRSFAATWFARNIQHSGHVSSSSQHNIHRASKNQTPNSITVVLIHAQMLIFHCSVFTVHTRLLCGFYNKRMNEPTNEYVPQTLTDFQNSFADRLGGKFATDSYLNIPPHLNYVAMFSVLFFLTRGVHRPTRSHQLSNLFAILDSTSTDSQIVDVSSTYKIHGGRKTHKKKGVKTLKSEFSQLMHRPTGRYRRSNHRQKFEKLQKFTIPNAIKIRKLCAKIKS